MQGNLFIVAFGNAQINWREGATTIYLQVGINLTCKQVGKEYRQVETLKQLISIDPICRKILISGLQW